MLFDHGSDVVFDFPETLIHFLQFFIQPIHKEFGHLDAIIDISVREEFHNMFVNLLTVLKLRVVRNLLYVQELTLRVNLEKSLLDRDPIFEGVIILDEAVVGDAVLFEGGWERVGKDGAEGIDHVVQGLSHGLWIGDDDELGLGSGLDKSVQPTVLYLTVQLLKLVLYLSLTENILDLLGLLADLSLEEGLQGELFFP
jgi:hypothetical protein